MFPHFSPAFQRFVAPARERSEIWRTMLGFVLAVAFIILIGIILALGLTFGGEFLQAGLGFGLMNEIQESRTIFATLSQLFLISTFIPALWLVLRFLHKRPLRTLLGPNGKINWRYWRFAVYFVLALAMIDVATTLSTSELTQQMPVFKWALWLLPSLVLLFAQTTAEELLFRGYLQQQLAARFKSRWIWWVMPAVIFGAFHWNPTSFGENAAMVVVTTTLMGLILADITARFGSLSPAMGLHFANNLVVMLFMNTEGQLSGMSFYLYDIDLQSPELGFAMLVSLSTMILGYIVFMFIMRQRRL